MVTECPLIVMFLFQLYDTHAPNNVKTLLPLMVKAINLRAPSDATRRSPQHTQLFVDFIAAQVQLRSPVPVNLLLLQHTLHSLHFPAFRCYASVRLLCCSSPRALREPGAMCDVRLIASD